MSEADEGEVEGPHCAGALHQRCVELRKKKKKKKKKKII